MALIIKLKLQIICKQVVPISMITDSLSHFDILTCMSTRTEKRLKVDLKSEQKLNCSTEVTDVTLILPKTTMSNR